MIQMIKQGEITVVTLNSEDEEEDYLLVKNSSFDAPTSISTPSATTSLWDPLEHGHTFSASSETDQNPSSVLLSVDEDLVVLGFGLDASSYDILDERELTFVEVHTELQEEPDIDNPDPEQQKVIQTKSDGDDFVSEASTTSAQLRQPQPGKRKACRQRSRATKKFAGNKKVSAKEFKLEVGVRRNPRRSTATTADYNENRRSQSGKQLTSEYRVNLCKTYNLQHRVYRRRNKYGAGVEMTDMPENFWPADTLDRPTLRDVASQLPTPPPTSVTWGIATHHLLHCVLAMITRFKSTKNAGFDRVAGKLYYAETLVTQLKSSVKDEDHEKDKVEDATKETTKEKENTKKPELEFVDAGIMFIDLTGDDPDDETVLQEGSDWFDELEPCSEVQLCESVCEVLAKVRDVEMRLREQAGELLLREIIPNPTATSGIEFVNVPCLDDLEELLERASYVYRLANRDVSRQGLNNYLASVERKEALRQARREVSDLR